MLKLFVRYAAASVVIGTGAYIGKMSPDQILVIGFIQVRFFLKMSAWANELLRFLRMSSTVGCVCVISLGPSMIMVAAVPYMFLEPSSGFALANSEVIRMLTTILTILPVTTGYFLRVSSQFVLDSFPLVIYSQLSEAS